MKIVYFTVTGQTKRFLKKLEIEGERLTHSDINITEPFVLITPTYNDSRVDFLFDVIEKNLAYCKGIIGSGNRNFGPEFCLTARQIAAKFNLPILYEFEFNGTKEDVQNVKGILKL